jgi:bromodomain-containing protein 8
MRRKGCARTRNLQMKKNLVFKFDICHPHFTYLYTLGPSSHNTRARITRHATRTEEQVALKRFQNVIGMLHSQISQHRNGNIFHNPIKNSEAPDYHEIVKRPMDLKTIKTRFKDGVIGNSLEYQRDIYLMFANAMMYNRPGSDVHAMAEDVCNPFYPR